MWEGFEGCWGQGAHFRAGLDASVFIAPRIFFTRIDVSLSERAVPFVRTNVSSASSVATAFATFGVGLHCKAFRCCKRANCAPQAALRKLSPRKKLKPRSNVERRKVWQILI